MVRFIVGGMGCICGGAFGACLDGAPDGGACDAGSEVLALSLGAADGRPVTGVVACCPVETGPGVPRFFELESDPGRAARFAAEDETWPPGVFTFCGTGRVLLVPFCSC
jgi:hypothetical protein